MRAEGPGAAGHGCGGRDHGGAGTSPIIVWALFAVPLPGTQAMVALSLSRKGLACSFKSQGHLLFNASSRAQNCNFVGNNGRTSRATRSGSLVPDLLHLEAQRAVLLSI